jgi:adenosine deaminase
MVSEEVSEMSLESFIRAMPKVDLHVEFEGSLPKELITRVADQNDILSTMKQREYNEWMGYLNKPDYKKTEEIARVHASWLKYPEDLSRAVYEVGVRLNKQNIRYAEVYINPAIYTDNGLSFEQFLDAINDGRDKVLRGWQVRMDWILTIPRERPRKGDDIARWVLSSAARKGNVIAMGIVGREDLVTADQFSKQFSSVERKDIPTATPVRSMPNVEPLVDILALLNPKRITDVWGVAQDPAQLEVLQQKQIPVVITPTRELRMGRISNLKDYPLAALMDNVPVSLSAGFTEVYRTTLSDEYLNMATALELQPETIEQLALNAVMSSFLSDEAQATMNADFSAQYEKLRKEHLA